MGGPYLAREVDALYPFRIPDHVSASFFLLINLIRDSMYNNTIGITIRSAVCVSDLVNRDISTVLGSRKPVRLDCL